MELLESSGMCTPFNQLGLLSSSWGLISSWSQSFWPNMKTDPYHPPVVYTLPDWQDIPQQENAFDCGIFVCQFMDCLSRDWGGGDTIFDFDQGNMPYIRRKMIHEVSHLLLYTPCSLRCHVELKSFFLPECPPNSIPCKLSTFGYIHHVSWAKKGSHLYIFTRRMGVKVGKNLHYLFVRMFLLYTVIHLCWNPKEVFMGIRRPSVDKLQKAFFNGYHDWILCFRDIVVWSEVDSAYSMEWAYSVVPLQESLLWCKSPVHMHSLVCAKRLTIGGLS